MNTAGMDAPVSCKACGTVFSGTTLSNHQRNHCPACLHSLHVDIRPGDRANLCRALMQPLALLAGHGDWQLLHRCTRCGHLQLNRISADDDPEQLRQLLYAPLKQQHRGPDLPATAVAGIGFQVKPNEA